MAELMKDLTGLHDSWVDDGIKDVESLAARLDEAVVPKQCEVLGQVCLGQLGYLEEKVYASLPLLEDVEHLKALGIGQDLVYVGVFGVRLLGQRRCCE